VVVQSFTLAQFDPPPSDFGVTPSSQHPNSLLMHGLYLELNQKSGQAFATKLLFPAFAFKATPMTANVMMRIKSATMRTVRSNHCIYLTAGFFFHEQNVVNILSRRVHRHESEREDQFVGRAEPHDPLRSDAD
jgi:hypothetical protein